MIIFREIGKNNYVECIRLKVKGEQRGFVADSAHSLAEAQLEKGLYTRTVYSDDVVVEFVLSNCDPEFPGWCMSRFMIGAQCQGRGLDKEAVFRFLDFMRKYMGVWEFYLHVELENTAAHEMYQKLGFRAIREIQYTSDGVVYREWWMRIYL